MTIAEFWPHAVTAIASFVGAWLAARFALSRFYREKVWERKAAAYTAIFEALQFIEQWFSEHQDAYFEQREISDEETKRLSKASDDAEAELARRLASETWLIPNKSRLLLNKLTQDLKTREQDWLSISTPTSDASTRRQMSFGICPRRPPSLFSPSHIYFAAHQTLPRAPPLEEEDEVCNTEHVSDFRHSKRSPDMPCILHQARTRCGTTIPHVAALMRAYAAASAP